VKLKQGDLTFSAVRVFMDNKIPVEYKLTITGTSQRERCSGVRGHEAGV